MSNSCWPKFAVLRRNTLSTVDIVIPRVTEMFSESLIESFADHFQIHNSQDASFGRFFLPTSAVPVLDR